MTALPVVVGSLVEAVYQGRDRRCHGCRYPGRVGAVNADGTVYIQYDDEDSEDDVPLHRVQMNVEATAAATRASGEVQQLDGAGQAGRTHYQRAKSAQQQDLGWGSLVPAHAKKAVRGKSSTRREKGLWTGLDPAAAAREKRRKKKK